MNDVMTILVAVSGVGFGLGLCGIGLIAIVRWLDDRDEEHPMV